MGRWDEWVDNNNAHVGLRETAAHLQGIRDRLESAPDVDGWDRLNRITEETRARLDLTPRALLTTRMLNQLDDALSELNRVLEVVVGEESLDLDATGAPVEALAEVLVRWPSLPPAEMAEADRAAVNGLRDATQSAMVNLEERLRELTEHADALRGTVSAADVENSQTLEALRTEVTGMKETIAQQEILLDQAMKSNELLFEQAQNQRSSEFTAAENQRATEHTSLVDKAKGTLDAAATEVKEKAEAEAEAASTAAKEHIGTLEKLREQARDLVGVIGRTGMTGGYQQDAVAEEKSANLWRLITIGFATGAVIVLGIAVVVTTYFDTDLTRLVSKTLLSAALGGIATYAARQSAHHRANARNARNLELALASIGPYLEPLDDEKRKEVLEVFAYILFAQRPVSPDSSEAIEMGPTNVQTLIEAIQRATRKE
jgi:hypothetical protein